MIAVCLFNSFCVSSALQKFSHSSSQPSGLWWKWVFSVSDRIFPNPIWKCQELNPGHVKQVTYQLIYQWTIFPSFYKRAKKGEICIQGHQCVICVVPRCPPSNGDTSPHGLHQANNLPSLEPGEYFSLDTCFARHCITTQTNTS